MFNDNMIEKNNKILQPHINRRTCRQQHLLQDVSGELKRLSANKKVSSQLWLVILEDGLKILHIRMFVQIRALLT
jgi:hypothetical protein